MESRPSVAKAGAWSAVDVLARQGANFLAMVVLARLLAPGDFGIIALISFFSNVAIAVLQGGLSTALIQRPTLSTAEESAAFWWGLIASSIVAGLFVIAGPSIAKFYKYPAIAPLMAVAAGQIVLSSLVSVQSALLARELRFATLAKAGVASTLISGLLAILAAVMGAGIWSLAVQLGTTAALNTIVIWWLADWRPTYHFSLGTLRPFLAFGGYLSVSNFLEVLYSQGFALIVGKRYGAAELGLYSRATTLQLVASSAFAVIFGRVALPLFTAQSNDEQSLLSAFRTVLSMAMLLNVPIMCGMAVLADPLLVLLYGKKWASAAPILSILSVGGIFFPIHAINLQLILSRGRADIFFWIEFIKKIVGIFCIIVGSFFGLFGLAYGTLIGALLALLPNTFMTKRVLNYGLMSQLLDLAGIFVCSAVMVGILLVARKAILLPPVAALPLLVIIGGATYLLVGFALRLKSFRDAFEIATILLERRHVEIV